MNEIVYAIKNEDGKYATYGDKEFHENFRFARLYKSKKTALKNYFNRSNNYDNLILVKVQIKELEEELINPNEFAENRR